MNKLKRPNHGSTNGLTLGAPGTTGNTPSPASTSRTMMYAQASVTAGHSAAQAVATVRATVSLPQSVKPITTAEHYWAARALTAETLLSARLAHHDELRVLSAAEEDKRAREIALLHRQHEMRMSKMEKLVILLLCCLVAAVAAIVHSHSTTRHAMPTGWAIPTHFTIPILSPFTSVVEHEASLFSTRLLVASTAIVAVLAYACFRYWITHARKR